MEGWIVSPRYTGKAKDATPMQIPAKARAEINF
jgi:hypothetical protein